MRHHGLLHGHLLAILARVGHGDSIAVSDAGLPVPRHVDLVDLAVAPNLPGFLGVLGAIMEELVVESAVVASETLANASLTQRMQKLVPQPWDVLSHHDFKSRVASTLVVVRTGEFTRFANIILVGGVRL